MKMKQFFFAALAVLALSAGFTSCSDDDDNNNNPSSGDTKDKVAFILNEGAMSKNNASITGLYWADNTLFGGECVYKTQNQQAVGDVGQDLVKDGDNMFLIVWGSAYIAKLDKTGKELVRADLSQGELASLGSPRYGVVEGNYLYVSCYGNCVAKFKKSDLSYVSKVTVGNRPERLIEEDGYIYCTSSTDESYQADNRLAKIDIKEFKEATFFTPMSNQDRIMEVDDRVFIQGYGDAFDYPWGEVNTTTGEFTKIGNASTWAENDDVIYTVNSVTDWDTYATTNYFATYDVEKSKYTEGAYLKNAPAELASTSVFAMEFNPYNDYLYVMTTDFTNNSKIYVFNEKLEYVSMFESTGVNSKKIVFFN
ncbi:MAG: hypothetical protein IJ607_10565 [Bacteroidaceae bacterium]|nr:hypothetical protein [Bacteroidaceae bacterium]